MEGYDHPVTGTQIRNLVGDGPLTLSNVLVEELARHICLMFYKLPRAVAQGETSSESDERPSRGVSTGQPHRAKDYQRVADFLDAIAEGSINENGNPSARRPCTIRDRLGISLFLAESVAAELGTSHRRIVETLASSPFLFEWWCDITDECESAVGAMPMSELLFRYSSHARRTLQEQAQAVLERQRRQPSSRPSNQAHSSGTASYKMEENRINGLCQRVWSHNQGQYLTLENGEVLRSLLEDICREHGPKVARLVVVRLRTRYDPTSQWCSRDLWRQMFNTYIPLDTGTQ